jgi:putative transcriptional regulator
MLLRLFADAITNVIIFNRSFEEMGRRLSALLQEIRLQLTLSQEDLARQLGVSYATVNRWENDRSRPSKLAKVQFVAFVQRMTEGGGLVLPEEGSPMRRRDSVTPFAPGLCPECSKKRSGSGPEEIGDAERLP